MARWIKALIGSVLLLLFVGLLVALVWFANEWITSTLATATVLVWLALWLVVVYRRQRVRAMAVGALLAGGVYWMLVLGPWFSINIGSTLLTSRLLAWISVPSVPAGQQLAIYTSYTPVNYTGIPVQTGEFVLSGSGLVTTSPQVTWTYPTLQTVPAANASSRQAAGQWAFTWLFALAGGGLAWWFAGWAAAEASNERKPASGPSEANP